MATASTVASEIATLTEEEREKLYKVVGLGPPPPVWVGPIWLIVVVAFATAVVGGGFLVYLLILGDKETADLLPIITAAVGVLAGILAPSPVASSNTR